MHLTQRHWRTAGTLSLVAACAIAGAGIRWQALRVALRTSPWYFVGYWGLFFLLIAVAVYLALLDLRYIRLQYAAAQRRLIQETFEDQEFRNALKQASKQTRDQPPPPNRPD